MRICWYGKKVFDPSHLSPRILCTLPLRLNLRLKWKCVSAIETIFLNWSAYMMPPWIKKKTVANYIYVDTNSVHFQFKIQPVIQPFQPFQPNYATGADWRYVVNLLLSLSTWLYIRSSGQLSTTKRIHPPSSIHVSSFPTNKTFTKVLEKYLPHNYDYGATPSI